MLLGARDPDIEYASFFAVLELVRFAEHILQNRAVRDVGREPERATVAVEKDDVIGFQAFGLVHGHERHPASFERHIRPALDIMDSHA